MSKKFRGKCPKCQTINISSAKSFKCRRCGHELQLRGKNAAVARRTFALTLVPVTMALAVAGLLIALLVYPRPVMRMLGYSAPSPFDEINSANSALDRKRQGELTEYTPEELFAKSRASVATIICFNEDDEPIGSGSGFFVEYEFEDEKLKEPPKGGEVGYVITNHHVVHRGLAMEIRIDNSVVGRVLRIVQDNPEADLSLLEVHLKAAASLPLQLSKKDPEVGSTVFAIGSPYGLDQTFSKGMVSGRRTWHSETRRVQTTSMIDPGSSGGPILNVYGQVVGVAVESIEGSDVDFAVPPLSIHDLLARKPSPRVPSQGRSFTKEVQQTLERLNRSANVEKDSMARVLKEQMILAATVADKSPESALEILEPVLDDLPSDWKFFGEFLAGRAYGELDSKRAEKREATADASEIEAEADLQEDQEDDGESSELERSIDWLRRSIKSNGQFLSARAELCKILETAHRYDEGRKAAMDFAKSSPECPDAYVILARFYELTGEEPRALQWHAGALALDPINERLQEEFLAFVNRSEGAYGATIGFLNDCSIASSSRDQGTWLFLLGLAYQNHEEFNKACESFIECARHDRNLRKKALEHLKEARKSAADKSYDEATTPETDAEEQDEKNT